MDKQKKILLIALFLSLIFHIAGYYLLDFTDLLALSEVKLEKSVPEEIEFIFPENKPKEVVQNMNETEERPDKSDYLSDKNSRARNPIVTDKRGDNPFSKGNTPFSNLSSGKELRTFKPQPRKRFSKEAITGQKSDASSQDGEQDKRDNSNKPASMAGSNQVMNQQDFSVEEVGALTLSTYQWPWAPYINAMKNKLNRVWYPPPAYYMLGIIHGYTIIRFVVTRDGHLKDIKVLRHEGHESLKLSSEEAIKALFPFLPLPDEFPDETLTITAKLYYPDLRRRR
ncbi:MAG TPA: hypothetical protein EYP36_05990 [Calditrichaeota bacterium]|nr:hypothetical protein [Calditrichota bacterium]